MNTRITQQERLLKELYKGKVNSYSATYSMRIKQAPTRIKELRDKGYNIISIPKTDGSVDWTLQSKIESHLKPLGHFIFIGTTAIPHDGQKEECKRCNPEPVQQQMI